MRRARAIGQYRLLILDGHVQDTISPVHANISVDQIHRNMTNQDEKQALASMRDSCRKRCREVGIVVKMRLRVCGKTREANVLREAGTISHLPPPSDYPQFEGELAPGTTKSKL